MIVHAPHTRVHPDARAALNPSGPLYTDVSGDHEAYWRLLDEAWAQGDTFCVVEHDVVVRPDTISELQDCPARWCAFEVSYVGTLWAGLSCTKFAAPLLADHPTALEDISMLSDADHPQRHWCRLDAWLQNHLHALGEVKCVHRPPLQHLRDDGRPGPPMPSHTCWR